MRPGSALILGLLLAACSTAPLQPNPAVQPSAPSVLTPTAEPRRAPTGTAASSNALPDPAGARWVRVTEGLAHPVDLQTAGDDRLFVVEQAGVIRILRDGRLVDAPFLDIRDRVGSQGSEQGLLGLAFDPRPAQSRLFYVNYTDRQGDTVIARYRVSSNPDRADPASETALLHIDQPYPNHNGGGLAFGPDGYLYIGLGDGGSGGDPQGNGQNLDTLLGKLLRIDVAHGQPYAIPPDNPFARRGGRPEIWAYGLRNPWRFAFDRLTGDLYIADVGQDLWEEIDVQAAGAPGGANYGWNLREGRHAYTGASAAGLIDPVAEYGHDQGCSVTGGVAVRSPSLPAWQGVYLYGDFCSGLIWGLRRDTADGWQDGLLFQTGFAISSFGQDRVGEVYVLEYGGAVYRLAPAS